MTNFRGLGLRTGSVLALTVALLATGEPSSSADIAAGCIILSGGCDGAGTTDDSVYWRQVSSRGPWEPERRPGSPSGPPGVTYRTAVSSVCGPPLPPDGGEDTGADCAASACTVGATPGRNLRVWTRQQTPAVGPWQLRPELFCSTPPGPPVTRAQVAAAAREYIEKRVSPGTPDITPTGHTLVNFPNIVSTNAAGPVAFDVTVPLPGHIEATPGYAWTFTDSQGTTTTATDTGRPYDGTSPRVPGYYLTATFTHSGPATVTLRTTWTATVTVQDQPPVVLDPIVFQNTVGIDVQQRRPVLIDPYG